ncbi:protein lethal(2)essential for life [Solenopsis invicta]|uniref:protein lethal(2)essential for life n=1 Tax=Solenopsis invicta TaxID=13686 RepID=UPI000595DFE0|nr:protein lethal(2)essential for life [Solenopsis invicta]
MALVSRYDRSIFRNWWNDIDRYHREIEEHFRKLSLGDDFWRLPRDLSIRDRFRPWRDVFENLEREMPGGWATVESTPDKYKIIVDVHPFTPEEITVRTDDTCITVEAKHHNRKDRYGYVQRQFTRRYLLPIGYDISRVEPSLSTDGILTITAPKVTPPGDRILPIRRTYFPAIKFK